MGKYLVTPASFRRPFSHAEEMTGKGDRGEREEKSAGSVMDRPVFEEFY